MTTLYLTEQGAKLGVDYERLEVRKDDAVIANVPLGHVDQIVIVGNLSITTPALKRLMQRGIDLAFVTMDGQFCGRIVGETTPHIVLRRALYRWQADAAFTLAMAQRVVAGKVRNQKVLLQRWQRDGLAAEIPELPAIIEDLTEAEARAGRTQNLNSLRGVEGSATARYFGGYRGRFGAEWRFEQRNRRPPRDPVNVMLSLGYTLLLHTAQGAVEQAGLDPYVGFLHSDEYNRPSLALDLAEEFRAVVEALVERCVRTGVVTTEDFRPGEVEQGERVLVMEQEAVKRFVTAYEQRMRQAGAHPRSGEQLPLWRWIELQAREVARCVREGEATYQAVAFR